MSKTPASPTPSRFRFLRRLAGAFVVLVALLVGACAWLLVSESGLRRLVDAAAYFSDGAVRVEGASGRLSGPLEVSKLVLETPGARVELVGVALDWQPSALFSLDLVVTRLRVEKALVFLRETQSPPPSSKPLALPESLRLPFGFDLAMVELGRLAVFGVDGGDGEPVFALTEGRLSANGGDEHFSLRELAADLPQGRVEVEGELGAAAPFPLRAGARLTAEGVSAQVEAEGSLAEPTLRLQGEGWGARGTARLALDPFAALPLKWLELDAEGVDPLAFHAGLPRADLRLHARLEAEASGLRGSVRIENARPGTLDAGALPVSKLGTEISLNAALDELRLDALACEAGGGQLTGWLRWRKDPAGAEIPDAAVLPAGMGRLDAQFAAQAFDPARFDSRLPSRRVDVRLEAAADALRQSGKLSLRTGAARLDADGEMVASAAGAPAFVLNLDLGGFDPSAFHPASPRALLELRASLTGALAEKPLIAAQYVFGNSRFNGQPLGGRGLFSWDGAHVRSADLVFDFAGNHLKLAGAWGGMNDRLELGLDAPRLAAVGFGLEGRMRATGVVSGGLEAPSGTLKLDAGDLRLPGVLEVASVAGEARIEAGEDAPFAVSLRASGFAAGDLRLASARLALDGRASQHRMQAGVDGKFGENAIVFATTLEGGLKESRWNGRIVALENGGQWPVRLRAPAMLEVAFAGFEPREARLSEAVLDAGEQGQIHLAETHWTHSVTSLRGSLGGLGLPPVPGLQSGRRDPLKLGAEWDMRFGEAGIEGKARLFRASGDLSVRGEISTRLGLDLFETYLFGHRDRLMLVVAAHGREAGELGLSIEAGIERAGQGWRLAPHGRIEGAAHLDMPSLAMLGRLMRENVEIGGALAADLTFSGTPESPDVQGRVAGRALQLSFVDQGLSLSGGELDAGFTHRDGHQRLNLTKLEFESPNRVRPGDKRLPVDELTATPGRLRVTGDIALGATKESEAAQRGQFEFTADRLPLLQRADRWLIVSGEGQARLQDKALDVDARMRADAGYIRIDDSPAPSLGDDVVVRGRSGGTEADAEQEGGGGLAIAGKIAVELGRALYLEAFGVETRLGGRLDVELRPRESPRVLGTIRTVEGSYRGYGQRLSIERGAITFQGDPANPALNIVAMRRGMEVDAGVAIMGDAHHPQIKLVSEPSVPDHEKLSWLVLGHAPDAGGGDFALLMPAAQALFGGSGGGMSEDLARKLGFDSFSIGQGELNSSSRSATSKVVGGGSRISSGPTTNSDVVSVGKRLTNDLSLSFEQSLGGAESLVKLTYRLGQSLSLVARGGSDNAVDLYYTYVFRDRTRGGRGGKRRGAQMEKRDRAAEAGAGTGTEGKAAVE